MRKLFLILGLCLLISGCGGLFGLEGPNAFAEETTPSEGLNISLKQGFLYTYTDGKVKNLTAVEIAKTKAVESWGKWNALWAGWSIDAGFAYDGNQTNIGAIMIGREFGTLGDYLPISFPLKDKINITIYPIAIYAEDLFSEPSFKIGSGAGIIKLSLKF